MVAVASDGVHPAEFGLLIDGDLVHHLQGREHPGSQLLGSRTAGDDGGGLLGTGIGDLAGRAFGDRPASEGDRIHRVAPQRFQLIVQEGHAQRDPGHV